MFDGVVIGVGVIILVALLAATVLLKRIGRLTRQAEVENNKLRRENEELRDKIEELTPKPQSGRGLSVGMVDGIPDNVSVKARRMFEGIPPAAHQRNIREQMQHNRPAQPVNSNIKPSTPWPRTNSVPSSSSVRDVHHHHHHNNDDSVPLVVAAAVVLSSGDDSPRSAPQCSPSRDSDYSSPYSDSGDSSSPSCD